MTPGARVAAAIGVLDAIGDGAAAEQALLGWARRSRYAGSGDRAAVRDLVFTALRRRRSLAVLGGAGHGRGLMLGLLRAEGRDPAALFDGAGHAPAPLSPAEAAHLDRPAALSEAEALDCPDWLLPLVQASLGAQTAAVLEALRHRAPVFLRVNLARIDRADAQAALAAEGIATEPSSLAGSALRVTENERRLQASASYRDGLVELQDAASQALVDALPLTRGARVHDHCAGGGGKALAIAARQAAEGLSGTVTAHDAAPARLRDLPARAARAGVDIPVLAAPQAAAPFDMVLADVPCSGSGSWRRAPDGKWRLTPDRLGTLCATQDAILDTVVPLVAPHGWLAYATCSLLDDENDARIAAFRSRHPGWHLAGRRRWSPLDGGDGFFLALLTRDRSANLINRGMFSRDD